MKRSPSRYRRPLLIAGLLLFGTNSLYLVLTSEPTLNWLARRFLAEDLVVPSDAIVVLLGSPDDRAARAAELYRQGLAPIVLMGRTEVSDYDETELNRRALIRGAVPSDAIRILPGGTVKNTHDEALRLRDYARTNPVHRVLVVTTAFHTARARWTFRRVLRGLGVDVRMAASRGPEPTEADGHSGNYGIGTYALETLKSIYYRVVY